MICAGDGTFAQNTRTVCQHYYLETWSYILNKQRKPILEPVHYAIWVSGCSSSERSLGGAKCVVGRWTSSLSAPTKGPTPPQSVSCQWRVESDRELDPTCNESQQMKSSRDYTIPYFALLYYTTLEYTILYYTILHYTTLYYIIILYYTILYYTIHYTIL